MGDTLSAIVCAYTEDRWGDIVDAIHSLQRQEPAPTEILLVIDHNRALFEKAEAEFDGIRIVESSQPKGLSGARNCGVATSSGDIVAFLDDDAAARPGWATAIVGWFADSRVVGVGGAAAPRWPTTRPSWFPPEFDWVVGCSYVGLPSTPAPVRNPIGCNMAFRRDALDRVPGFDTAVGRVGTTPLGCEETELAIRLLQAVPGSKIMYDPGIVVDHRVTLARTSLRYFGSRCWAEGLSKAMVRASVGSGDALASERAYVTSVLPRAVLAGLRAPRVGWARAAIVVFGLGTTAAGYAVGLVRTRPSAASRSHSTMGQTSE